ncbi:MAG TPA: nucleoside deaminase [Saprospiraceae bacterium]|nr:nucleoside deaminase [Saprospiraceae bacterium]
MTQTQVKQYLDQAIEAARRSMKAGEGGPFGAAVIKDGEAIVIAANQVSKQQDPTAHAEIVAIREACQLLGRKKLEGCILISTCEPCPMCYSAIHFAGISRVYFAALHEEAGRIAGFGMGHLYEDLSQKPTQRRIEQQQVFKEAGWGLLEEWKSIKQ